jgi:hypothetical protein
MTQSGHTADHYSITSHPALMQKQNPDTEMLITPDTEMLIVQAATPIRKC